LKVQKRDKGQRHPLAAGTATPLLLKTVGNNPMGAALANPGWHPIPTALLNFEL